MESVFRLSAMLAIINNGDLGTYNLVHGNATMFGHNFEWLGF